MLCTYYACTYVGGSDVYDNVSGKQRPQKKKAPGMEEDIYGGVGDVDEGVYDTAGGRQKEIKYSEDGIYDNPEGIGTYVCYSIVTHKKIIFII